MNITLLEGLLRPYKYDLEIICVDNEKIFMHRILLGALSEFWADLFLHQDYCPGDMASVMVPSKSEDIKVALESINDNPDALLDVLTGLVVDENRDNSFETSFSEPIKCEDKIENVEHIVIDQNLLSVQHGNYEDIKEKADAIDLLNEKPILAELMMDDNETGVETRQTCEICKNQFFSKNMETHLKVHERKKAEKEQRREYRKQ